MRSLILNLPWLFQLILLAEVLASSLSQHRYRSRVAYDGTNFSGFQIQGSTKRTVQLVLESVFSQRLNQPIRVAAASRTDTGVHARGQAIHFDYDNKREGEGEEGLSEDELDLIEYSCNRMLPADVRIYNLQKALPHYKAVSKDRKESQLRRLMRWNAMMDCTGKLYSYRLNLSPAANHPLDRFVRWRPDQAAHIDVNQLDRLLKSYEGTHDFRAFAGQLEQLEKKSGGGKVDTVRHIYSVDLVDEGDYNYRIDFHLKGALYKQVRNMVGTVLDVCLGRLSEERFLWLLNSQDTVRKDNRSKPAPPQGLTLEQVYFDEDESF